MMAVKILLKSWEMPPARSPRPPSSGMAQLVLELLLVRDVVDDLDRGDDPAAFIPERERLGLDEQVVSLRTMMGMNDGVRRLGLKDAEHGAFDPCS